MDSNHGDSLLNHQMSVDSFNQDLAPDWMREALSTGVSDVSHWTDFEIDPVDTDIDYGS